MAGLNLRVFSNPSDFETSRSWSTTSFNTEIAKTQHSKTQQREEFHTNKFAQAKWNFQRHCQCGPASYNYLEKTLGKKFVCFPWEGRKEKPGTEVQPASSLGNTIPSHEVNTQVDESCLSTSPRGLRDISNRLPGQPRICSTSALPQHHSWPLTPEALIFSANISCSNSSQLQQNLIPPCQPKGIFLPIKVCSLYINTEVS